MKLAAFFVLIILKIVAGSYLDEGTSCIIQYLKNKKTLEEDFPTPAAIDSAKCRVVMPLLLRTFGSALRTQLSEKLTEIDVECVMSNFQNTSAIDHMLMRDIVPMSRELENSEITQKVRNSTKVLRKILLSVARKCNFDQSYGGLFDDILGLQNLSIPVLERNYCFTKYAIDNKLIEVKHVNVNPRRIPTANVDCDEMLDKNQIEREKRLLDKLNQRKLSHENIQCIMDKYRSEKAFASNVALEVINILNISYEEKRSNREQIANQLESFIKSIFACTRGSKQLPHNVNENVKILQL
jgi:hypothetical protein